MQDNTLARPLEQNLDIKRERRRWAVYMLYLEQKSQEDIAEVLDISRSTVVEDLTEMRRRIANRPPIDMEAIRQETYLRMTTLRLETIEAARASNSVHGKAKLYEVAAKLDTKILERYTLPGSKPAASKGSDIGMAVVDYIKEKFGPEELQKFMGWYEKRSNAETRIKEAIKTG